MTPVFPAYIKPLKNQISAPFAVEYAYPAELPISITLVLRGLE
jgi:hypothetical protein